MLPAYRWEQNYRRRIHHKAQPPTALGRGGPVIFVFDLSQTKETPDSRPVPASQDPLQMRDLSEAAGRLEWVIENAPSPKGARRLLEAMHMRLRPAQE